MKNKSFGNPDVTNLLSTFNIFPRFSNTFIGTCGFVMFRNLYACPEIMYDMFSLSSHVNSIDRMTNESTPLLREQRLVNFDQVLKYIGDFGLWQWLIISVLWLPPMGGGVIVLLWNFTGDQKSKMENMQ